MNDRPALSVVIAATDSPQSLDRSLESLRARECSTLVEVIVAAPRDRLPTPGQPGIVRWVEAAPGTGVPRLRQLGLEQARASVVAFTEDSCVFDAEWCASWILAFQDPRLQGGTGPVEPDLGGSPLDWAVFFCEYAPFLRTPPGRVGPPRRLAGNNFAVRRVAGLNLQSELHETELQRAMSTGADAVIEVSQAGVRHVRHYRPAEAFGDRFRFGMEFGRLRARRHAESFRFLALFAGPAIFAVQVFRLVILMLQRRSYLGRFLRSAPIVLALLWTWSIGESIGWAFAPRHRAAGRRHETGAPLSSRSPDPGGSRRVRYRSAQPPA